MFYMVSITIEHFTGVPEKIFMAQLWLTGVWEKIFYGIIISHRGAGKILRPNYDYNSYSQA